MSSSTRRLDSDAEVPEAAFDDYIVDLDFHVNPMPDELVSYVDDDVLADKLRTEFGPTPVVGKWDAAYAIKEGTEGLFTQGRAEYAEDVREACAKFAIDDPIVNPGVNTLNLQHHPLLKNAVCQASNDYMTEHFVDEGMYTAMMVPKWDPEYAVEEIVAADEERFVDFYNEAQPITLRLHQLNLFPGIGKKLRNDILDERKRKPFESFEEVSDRVSGLHDPKQTIIDRILEELREDDLKYRIFAAE